ncbi:hypothetical protein PSTT_16045, partial [Puccinia striiformis]
PSPGPRLQPSRNPRRRRRLEKMAPKYAAAHLIPKKEDGKEDRKAVARSRSNYLRTHFKNTRETAAAITGLKLAKALSFLSDVTEHKQCVPFRRFSGGVGRTAQAKAHNHTQVLMLTRPQTRRRTYRAHGRINPYQGHPCHVEIILTPTTEEVEKADEIVVAKRRGVRAPKAIAAS